VLVSHVDEKVVFKSVVQIQTNRAYLVDTIAGAPVSRFLPHAFVFILQTWSSNTFRLPAPLSSVNLLLTAKFKSIEQLVVPLEYSDLFGLMDGRDAD
jgi:hypothetical protein